jgi:hypothetical protein
MPTDSIPILALAVAIHMASFCVILFVSKLTTDVVNAPTQKYNKVHPAPQDTADTKTNEARLPLVHSSRVFNLKGFV